MKIKSLIAIMLAAAILLSSCGAPEREQVTEPAVTTPATTTKSPETTVPPTTTAETTVTTTEATTTTTEATTTVTTTTPQTTTEATTTTTEATTVTTTQATTVTTTAATTVTTTAATLGILGYDLTLGISTDKSGADGDITKIIINEICAKNKSNLNDRSGDYPDWIELYNPTDKAVNLAGAGLSDDADNPLKWVFPSVNIQPKGYLVVFCSDKDTTSPELHTNFKISGGNEELILSTADGKKIDSVVVPILDDDETYGIHTDNTLKILSATPGADNSGSKTARDAGITAPIFSKDSGFYSSAITLSMTAPGGTAIYYTTDGSIPTTSSQKYSSELTIKDRSSEKAVLMYKKGTTADSGSEKFPKEEFEKATVIRAIAVDSKGNTSPVTTATYFIGSKILDKYKNVSVISVVSDPSGLYDKAKGIFVAGDVFTQWRKENPKAELDGSAQGNYNQRGREWEREAHIDYFVNGAFEFGDDVGIRTHGGWSRNSQQKSLKFYFRSDYGESKLKYELFPGNRNYYNNKKITEYKRFMIRNGGNDSFLLLYKDPWTQACLRSFPFATQYDKLVICFLDGEYWGVYTMNEVYDNNYIEENYGIDADDAIMIKVGELEEGIDSDKALWDEAVKFVRDNDMSKPENYQKACEYFDMDSMTEYLAAEFYISNQDWVWNNWAVFRSRTVTDEKYHDGKWRFMMYDTEFSMDLYGSGNNYKENKDGDAFKELANGNGHLGPMFKSLLKSDDFKARFVLACEDVMNIAFNPSSASALLDKYHKTYSPYIPQHFKRYIFWQSLGGVEGNRDAWKGWLKNRQNYFPTQMNSILKLGTDKTKTVSINIDGKGTVKINSIPISFTNSKWSGKYFAGYKISIEAVPSSGYEFAGWSGGYTGFEAKITFDPTSDMSLTANFKEVGN